MADGVTVNDAPVDGIINALVRAQAQMPALQKSAINPHFKNKYVPLDKILETVLPILNDEGIALVQSPAVLDGQPALTTTLLHADSGQSVTGTMLLVMDKDTPQGQGSGITYARRYALQSMLGLMADTDDDAESANVSAAPVRRRRAPATTLPDSVMDTDPPKTNAAF